MRLLEALLIICSILLLYISFSKRVTQKNRIFLCVISSLILILQLLYEGYRWQLFFVYMISIVLILLIMFCKSKRFLGIKIWKQFIYILYCIAFVFILFSVCAAIYLPVFTLPKPDGLYPVGTQTFHLVDNARDEVLTENIQDKRELMMQVWYPAQNMKDKKRKLLFPEDKGIFNKYMQSFSGKLSVPKFTLDYWKYIKSNSYEETESLSVRNPYPVVLISHGLGTSNRLHYAQAENLASHGFVVVAIDHTYSTAATAFPDGKVTGFRTALNLDNFYEDGSKLGKIWTEDIGFVINQLEKMNSGIIQSKFKGNIDMNNIGVMGHSFGGATALNAMYVNEKVKAGINMDGSLYELELKQSLKKPFMLMETEDFMLNREKIEGKIHSDGEIKPKQLSEDKFNMIRQQKEKEYQRIDQVLADGGIMISIKGTAHYNFTDLQLFSDLIKLTKMTGEIDGQRGMYIVNQYVLDFFNKHLKGTEGQLISGPNANFPEVKFLNNEKVTLKKE
ncbi:alpha/beta hydrolase family protein [Bacillus gaemokensis]|uniref:Uncharacterized protein n=1 Tax=Bacillus gaemokensis TaxID=574375 RepID=A0A073K889_9BACI|nr:dienelactone hydrolase family protein [Bacillus gaemokensis]KEK23494.1 hypothetical protein BAGA_08350 [Bacillus gaemokensis]KYG27137.1 Platelet-activating factor acetylhydrolase plasma/intracellular isoform II [Bacillus gaemokensis]